MKRMSGVGRADILRIRNAVPAGMHDAELAALCGCTVMAPIQQPFPDLPLLTKSDVLETTPAETSSSATSTKIQRYLKFLQPISAHYDPTPTPVAHELDWLDGQCLDDDALTAKPILLPTAPPLTPWPRLWPYLHHALGYTRDGLAIDLARLTRAITEVRPLRRIPRFPVRAWNEDIWILLDYHPDLRQFHGDMRELLHGVARLHGWERLHGVALPAGDPTGGRYDVHRLRDVITHPPAGAPVLALSDLGCLDHNQVRMRQWENYGRALLRRGCRLTALVPCPRVRWQASLTQTWPMACWDRRETLPHTETGLRARIPDDDVPLTKHGLEELLILLVPAVRVEPGLLRALSHLLDPAIIDVGVEFDIWHHYTEVAADEDALVLLPTSTTKRRSAFQQLSTDTQSEVARLLKRYHQGYSPTVLTKEYRNLQECGVELSAEDQAYAEQKTCDLLETMHQAVISGDHGAEIRQGLFDNFTLDLNYLLPGEVSKPETIAGVAFTLEMAGYHTCSVPEIIDGAEVNRILTCMRSDGGEECQWEVTYSEHSVFMRPWQPCREHSVLINGARRYYACGNLPARAPRVNLQAMDSTGAMRQLVLELPMRSPLTLPDVMNIILRSDCAEVELASITRPPWARRLQQDQYGLCAEFTIPNVPNVPFRLRWIPPGAFVMGSSAEEEGRWDDEGPQHQVTITAGYWLAETPCTQAQWRAVMGKDPSKFTGDARPVEQVSWKDCQGFCRKLNAKLPELNFRLPTEAQWEYACRAGTNIAFNDNSPCTVPDGIDPALQPLGWHGEGSEGQTHQVRLLLPNNWGLYDMHGNVWEWCEDFWCDQYSPAAQIDPCNTIEDAGRVVRGGGYWAARGPAALPTATGVPPASGSATWVSVSPLVLVSQVSKSGVVWNIG